MGWVRRLGLHPFVYSLSVVLMNSVCMVCMGGLASKELPPA